MSRIDFRSVGAKVFWIVVGFFALLGTFAFISKQHAAPIASVIRMNGTVEGIQLVKWTTYRVRLENELAVFLTDASDQPRHWIGSKILVEQTTYEDGSISYRLAK